MCDALHSLQTQPQSTLSRELGTGRYLARETSTKDPGGVELALDGGGGGSAELEARLEGALAQLAALQVLCGGAWPRAAIERCRHPSHITIKMYIPRSPCSLAFLLLLYGACMAYELCGRLRCVPLGHPSHTTIKMYILQGQVNDVHFELEEKRAGGDAEGAKDAADTHAAHEEAIFELHTKLDEATEAGLDEGLPQFSLPHSVLYGNSI